MSAMGRRRVVVMSVLAAMLVAAALVGERNDGVSVQLAPPATEVSDQVAGPPTPTATDIDAVVPTASHAGAFSTTWYCVGGTATLDPPGPAVLELTNRGAAEVTARISAVGSDGTKVERSVSVGASATLDQPVGDLLAAPFVSAVIESRGADLSVAQRFATPADSGLSQCATRASTQWYFAGGSTDRGANEQLVVFNPFPDPATVDVTYFLSDGLRRPEKAQGIPVPGHATVVVRVGDTQDRVLMLGAAVTTRTGRVVAARVQTFDGTGEVGPTGQPAKGTSVTLGVPWAMRSFVLPDMLFAEGVSTQIVVTNPGPDDSTVRLDLTLDQPELNGQPTPITVDVPAHSWKLLGPTELRQLPPGVPFSARGTVTSGGPVVAEAWRLAVEPAPVRGVSFAAAVPVAATDWVLPLTPPVAIGDRLTVVSVGKQAKFTLSVIADGRRRSLSLPSTAPQGVGAGGRVSVDLSALLIDHPDAVVLVHADAPVIVARSWALPDALGVPLRVGYPVADTISLL